MGGRGDVVRGLLPQKSFALLSPAGDVRAGDRGADSKGHSGDGHCEELQANAVRPDNAGRPGEDVRAGREATLVAGLASHPGQRAVGLAVHRQARLRRLTFLTGRRGRKQQESFENSSSSTVLGDCPPTLRSLARRMKRSLCSQAVAFTQFVCYSR